MNDWPRLQANVEAKRRWGKRAAIENVPPRRAKYSDGTCRCGAQGCSSVRWLYTVGETRGPGILVHGRGHSWREAFAAAGAKSPTDEKPQ